MKEKTFDYSQIDPQRKRSMEYHEKFLDSILDDFHKGYMRPNKKYNERECTAYHEIGHAMADYILNRNMNSVEYIEIYQSGGGVTHHNEQHSPSGIHEMNFLNKVGFDCTIKHIGTLLGGMVAERVMCHRSEFNYRGATSDLNVIDSHCLLAGIDVPTRDAIMNMMIVFLRNAFIPYEEVMDIMEKRLYKKGTITRTAMLEIIQANAEKIQSKMDALICDDDE